MTPYPTLNEKSRPSRRNPLTLVVLILTALVMILGATTVLALRRASPSSVTAGPAATEQNTTQNPSPPTATSSANSPATSTPTLSPATTPQPVATVPSGVIPENLLLTCGTNCDDPIRVTITNIQVNDADGTMTWNISLKNVSGKSVGYLINTFELLASGTQNQIPANFSQNGGTLANSDPLSTQCIFTFVPTQNTLYTLTVVLSINPFGGPQVAFEPTQITNL
jgi:cytoskeletal protein RodZ